MTPKEKAAELIVNYQLKCKSLNYEDAKQCALIAVDEILEVIQNLYFMGTVDYWQEVKQEIEKL
jgi:hypothetical protein